MKTDLTSSIINHYLNIYDFKKCKKLIVKDGINTDLFFVEKDNAVINEIRFHAKTKKKEIISIGKSISIIKNLDHYQNLICINLPQIADNNPYKRELQKMRILIIGAFSKFSKIMSLSQVNLIEKWNNISAILLNIVSGMMVSYRSNQGFENSEGTRDQYPFLFEFFELDIKKISHALDYLYL